MMGVFRGVKEFDPQTKPCYKNLGVDKNTPKINGTPLAQPRPEILSDYAPDFHGHLDGTCCRAYIGSVWVLHGNTGSLLALDRVPSSHFHVNLLSYEIQCLYPRGTP